MKTTQKYIRSLLALPRTIDCTKCTVEEYNAIREKEGILDEIAYSTGTYGCNGVACMGNKTGTIYVAPCRSSAMFLFL